MSFVLHEEVAYLGIIPDLVVTLLLLGIGHAVDFVVFNKNTSGLIFDGVSVGNT